RSPFLHFSFHPSTSPSSYTLSLHDALPIYDFHRAFADAGWLGIAMPEAYGGAGLGIAEAAIMMQAVAESGAAFSGASALHMNILDRKSTRLNSSHVSISYAVFCL